MLPPVNLRLEERVLADDAAPPLPEDSAPSKVNADCGGTGLQPGAETEDACVCLVLTTAGRFARLLAATTGLAGGLREVDVPEAVLFLLLLCGGALVCVTVAVAVVVEVAVVAYVVGEYGGVGAVYGRGILEVEFKGTWFAVEGRGQAVDATGVGETITQRDDNPPVLSCFDSSCWSTSGGQYVVDGGRAEAK